jgi:cytochrome c peroxidase
MDCAGGVNHPPRFPTEQLHDSSNGISTETHCNECRPDGGPGEGPLFTDFTASNLVVPRNPALSYYFEVAPDRHAYRASPLDPDSRWVALAPKFDGKF